VSLLVKRSVFKVALGQYEGAIEDLARASDEDDPRHRYAKHRRNFVAADAQVGLGDVARRAGDEAAAIRHYIEARGLVIDAGPVVVDPRARGRRLAEIERRLATTPGEKK
jgi:hypothetical protein